MNQYLILGIVALGLIILIFIIWKWIKSPEPGEPEDELEEDNEADKPDSYI